MLSKAFLFFTVTLLGAFSIPLTAYGGFGIPLHPSEAWYQQQTDAYHQVDILMLNRVQQLHPGLSLKTVTGTTISFDQLIAGINTIQYRPAQQMILKNAPADVSCMNSFGSQWITKYDSPTGKPTVSTSKNMNVFDFGVQDARLALHESISSLGIIDDEYQVSAALNLLILPDFSMQDEAKAELQKVQIRSHAPQVLITKQESCYQWKGGKGIRLEKGTGGVTGIGGGGNGVSLDIKMKLLAWSRDWWKKNNTKNLSEAAWPKFFAEINKIGFELSNAFEEGIGQTFPVQFEIKKSKYSGKPTAYVYFGDFTGDDLTQATRSLVDHIYEHFYAELANNSAQCADHIIWGPELEEKVLGLPGSHASFTGKEVFYFKNGQQVSCDGQK